MAEGEEPLAIIGLACRLPGGNSSPGKLWQFMEDGKVASNEVPSSRFNCAGHWDGSHKPGTMRPNGGMFLSEQDVDLASFDASFFEIAGTEAIATDPNQRQMLEIVYEGLESAGIPMERINGASAACFVSSFAIDYLDNHQRDPEQRPKMTDLGIGRAILANRISWFFNLKGPSVTIDTACSGSLVALDMACRTLRSHEVNTAIIATSNLYMSPEHVIDSGFVGEAHSPTGLCHTFDAAADGYVKAEAVSCLIVKTLDNALRDRDPIRAVIRGVAINSNGRTDGIGSPSSEAQAAAIRKAYKNAGISNYNDTQYLECHGTGTQRGDAEEVAGVEAVFAATRDVSQPLLIGSIKANVGHAEPAAGLSGLIKTILSLEHGLIPGTPLFINPNPKIDFSRAKVKPFRNLLPWPETNGMPKRASVNSFGYGGANAHCILEELSPSEPGRAHHIKSTRSADEVLEWMLDETDHPVTNGSDSRPYTLVLSANDATSLKDNITALCRHLANPRVALSLRDLSYTLAQRRSHLWHRAFVTMRGSSSYVAKNDTVECRVTDFTTAKRQARPPSVGFVFTGQGAQWPQMGRDLLHGYPSMTRAILQELDMVLKGLTVCDPPRWSLLEELTEPRDAEHLRQPEYSQPLATALQLCLLAVLETWGISPSCVVGHSSGEIAAAYAAGLLSRADAIKIAFFRGHAIVASNKSSQATEMGMLAVGMSVKAVTPFLDTSGGRTCIACFNSPDSVTISGPKDDLKSMERAISSAGHFARLLKVDMAYHSPYMDVTGLEYEALLTKDKHKAQEEDNDRQLLGVAMFSSVTATRVNAKTPKDTQYWRSNLLSPVRFDEAVQQMLSGVDHKTPDILIEVGPSGALAGPISQILKSLSSDVTYHTAWSRGADAMQTLFNLAGRLFITGVTIDIGAVNGSDSKIEADAPRCIVDLPSYRWNHSARYWHESQASKDWRFRRFITHDLIGSKILGTPWTNPSWHKCLEVEDVPWLRHHRMDGDVLMPATAFCAMAIEAMYQKHSTLELDNSPSDVGVNDLGYGLRNVKFTKALVLDEENAIDIYVSLAKLPRSSADSGWHEFRISTSKDNVDLEHCNGLIRVQNAVKERLAEDDVRRQALQYPQSFSTWYKTQREVGMDFGPSFQRVSQLEAVSGQRSCRALVDLVAPSSKWDPQSRYSLHPAVLDACLHTLMAPNACNEHSLVKETQLPGVTDECFINPISLGMRKGLVLSQSKYSGRGRPDQAKGLLGNVAVYDAASGAVLMGLKNLHYATLEAPIKRDTHVFDAVKWQPDIVCLTQDQARSLVLHTAASSKTQDLVPTSRLQAVINLIAHKKPQLRVLELSLDDTESEIVSLWLADKDTPTRNACAQYDFAGTNAEALVRFQREHQSLRPDRAFHLAHPSEQTLGLNFTSPPQYDLAILQVSENMASSQVQNACKEMELLVADDGLVLVAHTRRGRVESDSRLIGSLASLASMPETIQADPRTELDLDFTRGSTLASDEPAVSAKSMTIYDTESLKTLTDIERFERLLTIEDAPNSHSLLQKRKIASDEVNSAGAKSQPGDSAENSITVVVPHLLSPSLSPELHFRLLDEISSLFEGMAQSSGPSWTQARMRRKLTYQLLPLSDAISIAVDQVPETIIMVVDELFTSVLATPSLAQWTALQGLLATGCDVVWLTAGAAAQNPERAIVHGLLRVVRREYSMQDQANRVVLDVDVEHVQPPNGKSLVLAHAVAQVLCLIVSRSSLIEQEYHLGNDGILLVPRLVPDVQVNDFRRLNGIPGATMGNLWAARNTVRLRGDRIGTLDLAWCECEEEPLEQGYVEVEVKAVGVNFKDVACLMGIIPEDEHMIGCECAGVVRRLGSNTMKFRIGDRVVVQGQGNYANRVQSIAHCVQVIPAWMTFEDAATMPLVYTTALRSLFHLGNLQQHQSVLIHSAAGGVGLAAIQLAQLRNADIFVTVSTREKRDLLHNQFGLPYDHMFSSRDATFASAILDLTQGRGVDVVLNSLAGDLLDASWRVVADGGTMIEIGKRDIYERNALSMEPFGRNCSFRALDLSYGKTLGMAKMTGELLREVFELAEEGSITPIRPITTYRFDDVQAALSLMRKGLHVGKIVITRGTAVDIQVPIRALTRTLQLRQDVSYLIIGGIKGLCGSLALHMARHGARHIIVCNRSGLEDETSQRVIRDCQSYGCEIIGQTGDVCDLAFVRRVFAEAHPRPIAGIIQGAMVLKDKPFEGIELEDYQLAVAAKVSGTWNLHHASLENERSSSQPLDFFSLLSSISGVVGNPGQASYSAANAFLDAFAAYRRSLGHPAHTIDLGAIEDVGYIAEQESIALASNGVVNGNTARPHLAERFRRDDQWAQLNEQTLRSTLTISILQQQAFPLSSSAQLVTGIAHPLRDEKLRAEPRFGYISGAGNGVSELNQTDGQNSTQDAAAAAVQAFVLLKASGVVGAGGMKTLEKAALAALAAQTVKVLRVETEVEVGKPLASYRMQLAGGRTLVAGGRDSEVGRG